MPDLKLPHLQSLLEELQLPDVLAGRDCQPGQEIPWARCRIDILNLLKQNIYGVAPQTPPVAEATVVHCRDSAFAGKAVHWSLILRLATPNGPFDFPLALIVPKRNTPAPVFLHIAFRPDIPDQYLPVEEIIDHGFAIANFCYLDIAADADDGFRNGLPALYPRDPAIGWGKIGVWAWAASRVMDYLQTRSDLDPRRIAIVGHSRLGKTALWCGAQDERFALVISNNSGCAGAALSRGKTGEKIADITRVFPFWFCGNYQQYANREDSLPFDQHFLLALTAPRALYISSAAEDAWADPRSEFLSALAASPVYTALGQTGLVTPDTLPAVGSVLQQGDIAYHLRAGTHFLSRTDWQHFMAWRESRGSL